MNWNEEEHETDFEDAVVLQSLVATVKLQPALDVSLEAKAVKFLVSIAPEEEESVDEFLSSFASPSDESLTNFVQSVVVLVYSTSHSVITAAIKMLRNLIIWCSAPSRLDLVKADLIPQLMNTLNPQSLSFAKSADIHTCLISTICRSFWIITPYFLTELGIEDGDEQQAIHEIVLQQILVPSEKYIRHLCVNRFSIIDGSQSMRFLALLASLLEISTYYQPTMDLVLRMPVVLTIQSCLTFFEHRYSIEIFMQILFNAQGEWNKRRGEEQRMWKTEVGMLRMEGFEDVTEQRLLNDQTDHSERCIERLGFSLANSIDTKLQDSTFVARGSIPIPLTTLPPLLHADKSHLRVKNTTFNPCKGVNESGNSIFNYPLVVSEEISSGIVSVTVTILSKNFVRTIVGLMESPRQNPEVDTGLGCGSKYCFSLWSNDGCVWLQQGPGFETRHGGTCHPPLKEGDCVRMEVGMDSKPRTLQFFVNGEAGQFYVSDLPTLVRIAFIAFYEGTSVRVDRITRQSNATPIKPGTSRLDWEEINSRMPACNSVANCPRHDYFDW
ncbi:hypothetical protein BLNAU_24505 [Blattamonas nauphoetae]|uniref:B30.2/SPRY domain-containing protein n=1 Tax=Blattamonas nauphoetae TaxID=2049346 RepID=A0ABQ9WMA7_9EUKA|nr:hypothetical protein BLNAU_24505 [Blattamonas nauphoetae]